MTREGERLTIGLTSAGRRWRCPRRSCRRRAPWERPRHQAAHPHGPSRPTHVLIVLFDQMRPEYADRFDMTNFKALRDGGDNFRGAYLGYMASETVISHNVIVSGQLPKHMGWVDEAYRDTENLWAAGRTACRSRAICRSRSSRRSFRPRTTRSSRTTCTRRSPARSSSRWARSRTRSSPRARRAISRRPAPGDIAVRLSGRAGTKPGVTPADPCSTTLGGQYRYPTRQERAGIPARHVRPVLHQFGQVHRLRHGDDTARLPVSGGRQPVRAGIGPVRARRAPRW